MPSSYTPPVNLAAPGPIGATTPAAITGTTLTVNTKLVVAHIGYPGVDDVFQIGDFGYPYKMYSAAGFILDGGIAVGYPGIASNLLVVNGTGTRLAAGQIFQLGNAATTGLIAGALAALTTASIVIYDSTGTAYLVPCVTP